MMRGLVGAVAVLIVVGGVGMVGYLAGHGTRPDCACGPCELPVYTLHRGNDAAVLCADDEAVLLVDSKQAKRVSGPCPRKE